MLLYFAGIYHKYNLQNTAKNQKQKVSRFRLLDIPPCKRTLLINYITSPRDFKPFFSKKMLFFSKVRFSDAGAENIGARGGEESWLVICGLWFVKKGEH